MKNTDLDIVNYLDLKFPWFQKGIKTVVPSGDISLRQFIKTVKNPKSKMKEAFLDIQEAAKRGDLKLKDELKQANLFFTTPSVQLNYRNYDSIDYFLPFAVLEYDKMEYGEELRDYVFSKFKSCIFAFLSPSKTGCKFIFLLEKCPESVEEYKQYYFGIAYHLDKFKGFDPSNERCVLPLFNSWDADAKFRDDAIGSSLRGYKTNAVNYCMDDVEIKGEHTEKEKKDCEGLVCNLIKRIYDNGHNQVLSASFIGGGLAAYYGIEDLWYSLEECIRANDYLSKGTSGYLKTANQLFIKGTNFPTPIKKD